MFTTWPVTHLFPHILLNLRGPSKPQCSFHFRESASWNLNLEVWAIQHNHNNPPLCLQPTTGRGPGIGLVLVRIDLLLSCHPVVPVQNSIWDSDALSLNWHLLCPAWSPCGVCISLWNRWRKLDRRRAADLHWRCGVSRAVGSEPPCWHPDGGRAASGRYSGESAAREGDCCCCCSTGLLHSLPDSHSPWRVMKKRLLFSQIHCCDKEAVTALDRSNLRSRVDAKTNKLIVLCTPAKMERATGKNAT